MEIITPFFVPLSIREMNGKKRMKIQAYGSSSVSLNKKRSVITISDNRIIELTSYFLSGGKITRFKNTSKKKVIRKKES